VEFKKPDRNALSMTKLQETDTTFQAAFDRERRQVAERFPKSCVRLLCTFLMFWC
jgi:hypothetical protein